MGDVKASDIAEFLKKDLIGEDISVLTVSSLLNLKKILLFFLIKNSNIQIQEIFYYYLRKKTTKKILIYQV